MDGIQPMPELAAVPSSDVSHRPWPRASLSGVSGRKTGLLGTLSLWLALASPNLVGAETPPATPADALQALRTLIGSAPCQQPADCRTIAIGANACGGPARYLAWSGAHTDEAALQKAAAAYPADRLSSLRSGAGLSTCQPVLDPGAYCGPTPAVDAAKGAAPRQCQLRSPGPGVRTAPDR